MEKLFDYFWKKYPKKVGKKQCKEHWKKLKPSPELYTKILIALDKQKLYKDVCYENNVFCPEFPHPIRWLKHERWEDEVPNIKDALNKSIYVKPNTKITMKDNIIKDIIKSDIIEDYNKVQDALRYFQEFRMEELKQDDVYYIKHMIRYIEYLEFKINIKNEAIKNIEINE